jgi:Predicted signal transduction protein containing sensor and EAL domains
MLNRKIIRWIRIVGPTLAIIALPMLIAEYVLSHHALSYGRGEMREMATAYVERADAMVAEALTSLRALKQEDVADCSVDSRQRFGLAAFNATYIHQIGLATNDGVLLCGEPMGALASPVRLPATTAGDPAVMLGILRGASGAAQATVTLRMTDSLRLVARLDQRAIEIEAGHPVFAAATAISIHLDDGSQWWSKASSGEAITASDVVVEKVRSQSLPVIVEIAAPPSAMQPIVEDLRNISFFGAIAIGVFTFLLGLWLSWQHNDGSDEFSRAVAAQEFVPYYQPVINIETGAVAGCEVLVRWIREDGTMVPPGAFLPYAEATGLIRDITRQLMAKTVEDVGELHRQHPALKISINLTASHFDNTDIVSEIREIYQDSGIAYRQLMLEVTEQHPLRDLDLSYRIIRDIQALGATLALDDAGTGHGGFAYLQKLGFDVIKIDKMFIDGIGKDVTSETIVNSLNDIGKRLDLKVIAEGVDSPHQIEYLKSIGVIFAQGFIYAKPLPAAEYIAFVDERTVASTDTSMTRRTPAEVVPAQTPATADAAA